MTVLRLVVLGLILAASHYRTFSLIHGYSAPLEAYKNLEHHEDVGVLVTTCCQATVALNLLQEREGCFDLVISNFHMLDMDGFKLLEHVGLELDLPVIMMSGDGRTSAVMRGVKHGACDYLIKPVRLEELKNVWQHIVRKRWSGNRDVATKTAAALAIASFVLRKTDPSYSRLLSRRAISISMLISDAHMPDMDGFKLLEHVRLEMDLPVIRTDGNWKIQKKRKDAKEEEDEGELENDNLSTSKKPRVVWSVELHKQFVTAMNQLGIDSMNFEKIFMVRKDFWCH
ncbi:hypothetical protein IFM89_013037 [Coptis chinensis]|uniref:Response regulatory domain-containing protein n=1 Tax=Coptis chinensis TaxID=261450 RepID=A0A835GZ17_9MAGN|nr:hypothetical protein IFM89_013037 [Coptis chinensis]